MTQVDDSRPQFQKALEHLVQELSSIRTGRSNPALVENINIEAYGAIQPLKALASISTPDAKTLQIEPWDGSVVKAIETALQKANLGMNPNLDGKTIRLIMPQMTDETRQQMVKLMKEKLEAARVAVRQVREEIKKGIEKTEGIGEDEKHNLLDSLEKLTKEMNGEIEEIGKKKEEQITTV
ncbi:MAG: ribosome recycling factor [bacterium]